MLGIGRDRQHRLGGRSEQEVVDHRLVLMSDIADRGWQCEHDVEVRHWQQLRRPRRHPLPRRRALTLRAVPVAAAIVGDGRVGAGLVLATHDVPAERRRAAALDRAHHLELAETDVAAVGVTPSGPVVAEDIRDLQGWATHEGPALCRGLLRGAPPSTASGARTDFSPRAARWWRRGHSGRWCPTSHGPTDTSHTNHLSTLLRTQRTSERDLLLAVDPVWHLRMPPRPRP